MLPRPSPRQISSRPRGRHQVTRSTTVCIIFSLIVLYRFEFSWNESLTLQTQIQSTPSQTSSWTTTTTLTHSTCTPTNPAEHTIPRSQRPCHQSPINRTYLTNPTHQSTQFPPPSQSRHFRQSHIPSSIPYNTQASHLLRITITTYLPRRHSRCPGHRSTSIRIRIGPV